ncbi:MAG: hypothetical protein EU539_05035 [Promethearchaeota archaeon]|nr:MAG: hypothetical protein EU539_05035 [Candidatus Lokiarchaeota archaeon]
MFLPLIFLIIQILTIKQIEWPWENQRPIEEVFEGPSIVLWTIAWIFFSLGIVSLIILVLYTKYGREISIKLSVITILLASLFLGFAFHFFLLNAGY